MTFTTQAMRTKQSEVEKQGLHELFDMMWTKVTERFNRIAHSFRYFDMNSVSVARDYYRME